MEESLFDLIMELTRSCIADEEKIRTLCNISLAEYKGISEIEGEEKISCNDLSKKMGLSPSRGSRIIDGLVRKGYLLRRAHPGDRRSFVLSLSPQGTELKKRIEEEKNSCEDRIRENLSSNEIELIKEGLELVIKVFQQNNNCQARAKRKEKINNHGQR